MKDPTQIDDTDNFGDLDFEPLPAGIVIFECSRGPRRHPPPPPVERGAEVRLLIEDMPRPLKPPGRR